jgi:hypothetical protein
VDHRRKIIATNHLALIGNIPKSHEHADTQHDAEAANDAKGEHELAGDGKIT